VARHPAPDCGSHQRFCEREGWARVTYATGGRVRRHETYELQLDDGSILRARIAHVGLPPDAVDASAVALPASMSATNERDTPAC